MLQSTGGSTNINVNIARAVARLNTVFITLDNTDRSAKGLPDNADGIVMKDFNSFYHPMQDGAYHYLRELQYQLKLGGKFIPEYPCRSLAQSFYELRKALGLQSSSYFSFSPKLIQYRKDHFIIGINTEKILEASFTGIPTSGNSLLTISISGANGNIDPAYMPDKLYVTLQHDVILEIRDTGAVVFD
jgi:hypothetical protein